MATTAYTIDAHNTSNTADSTSHDRAMKYDWRPINRHDPPDPHGGYKPVFPDKPSAETKPTGSNTVADAMQQMWKTIKDGVTYVWSIEYVRISAIVLLGFIVTLFIIEFLLGLFSKL